MRNRRNRTDDDIRTLNTRVISNEDVYDRYVSLFPTKAEAERVNRERINQLESKEYTYSAIIAFNNTHDNNKNIESVFPIISELKLKLGAAVMMVANDPEHRWVNGSLGIVKQLSEENIYISFGKNQVYEVKPVEFEEQEITYVDGVISYKKVFSVMQYPIVPSYAITIHKSQGQTYSDIACDIENCFESGQAYVALSRCASLNGLHLKSRITASSIKVNHDVWEFYMNQLSKNVISGK